MSKKEDAPKAEAMPGEAIPESPTVTLTADELSAILATQKELQRQLDELKQNARENDGSAEAERLLELVRRANEDAEQEVEIHVETGSLKANKNAEVSINGRQYIVPKGQTVKVPRKVAEIIENARVQKDKAYGIQETKHDEFEAATTKNPYALS